MYAKTIKTHKNSAFELFYHEFTKQKKNGHVNIVLKLYIVSVLYLHGRFEILSYFMAFLCFVITSLSTLFYIVKVLYLHGRFLVL